MAALQAALAKFRERAKETSNVLDDARKEREEKLAKRREADAKGAGGRAGAGRDQAGGATRRGVRPSLLGVEAGVAHRPLYFGPMPARRPAVCRPQGAGQAGDQGQELGLGGLPGRGGRLRGGRPAAAAAAAALEGPATAQPAAAAALPAHGGWWAAGWAVPRPAPAEPSLLLALGCSCFVGPRQPWGQAGYIPGMREQKFS